MSDELVARCRAALKASDETAQAATQERWCHFGTAENKAYVEANPPSTRLALNRALTVVLDGIAATLAEHERLKHRDEYPAYRRATASLAAIAAGLGLQEEGR